MKTTPLTHHTRHVHVYVFYVVHVQPIGNLIQIFAAQFADTHANRNTDIIESVSDNFMVMLSK